jgi:LEA14-like dessication related protein
MPQRWAAPLIALLLSGCTKGGLPKLPDLKELLPTVRFEKLKFDKVDFTHADATFVLAVDNPHPIGLELAELNWALSLVGSDFLDGKHGKGIDIDPKGTSKVRFPVSLQWGDLLTVAGDMKGKDEVAWGLDGDIAFDTPLGKLDVPYKLDGTMPVLHLPKVSLDALRVAKLDLLKQTATLELDVGMKSDQGTPLSIAGLNYGLKLSGTEVATGETRSDGSTVTLPIELKLLELGVVIVDAITKKTELKVGFDADATIGTPLGEIPLAISELATLALK